MNIIQLTTLTYQFNDIGMRIFTDKGIFDVDMQSLASIGVTSTQTILNAGLLDIDGVLLTRDELDKGYKVSDMSENRNFLVELQRALTQSPYAKTIFPYGQPYEIPKDIFINNPTWLVRVEERPPYGLKNILYKPNGTVANYGFLPDGDPLTAKTQFHYQNCKEALERGIPLSEEVLADYPKLREYGEHVRREKIKADNRRLEEKFRYARGTDF